ncbi:Uma2 family endonuclease [Leptolyngbya sp. FACHB-17]|uniref:Uma2 family endonuclease n=1 Tax=unclassified Leptolyngbya TaxID=2650499 RepID=UPI001681B699|nr:Uma2 family endonuclease [Leptolyngbya sp. FACHB-17]MBD2080832.1 Uma2 family endonuclease [Leptolyngbya sp. FACHB-17]
MTFATPDASIKLTLRLTDEQFFQLCQDNRDLQFERTAAGDIIIMPPTGSESGRRNSEITIQLGVWNKQTGLGEVFDSSSGFHLPNGADYAPDTAWVSRKRWDALTPEQKERFAPICPDVVIELRSKTDSLPKLQAKMREYVENGARLGWLLDRQNQRVEVYRPRKATEILQAPATISADDILPGFTLDLQKILY